MQCVDLDGPRSWLTTTKTTQGQTKKKIMREMLRVRMRRDFSATLFKLCSAANFSQYHSLAIEINLSYHQKFKRHLSYFKELIKYLKNVMSTRLMLFTRLLIKKYFYYYIYLLSDKNCKQTQLVDCETTAINLVTL